MENIKKLYKSAGKIDDQQQYKNILLLSMFSTPEILTDKIPMSPSPSVTVINPISMKSLRIYVLNYWISKRNFLSAG